MSRGFPINSGKRFSGDFSMDFLKYDIKDNGAFAPFISTMEDTGAEIEGSGVMFESDNSAAKMLADTLVEYEIMAPVMEARKTAAPAAGGGEPGNAQQSAVKRTRQRKSVGNLAVNGDAEKAKVASGNPKEVVVNEPDEKNAAIYCYGDGKKIFVSNGKIVKTEGSTSLASAQGATFELTGKPTIGQELKAKINGQVWHSNAPLTSLDGTAAQANQSAEKNVAIYCYGDDKKIYVSNGKIVKTEGSKSLASAQGATFELTGKPTIGQELKAKINGKGWHSNAPLTSLGGTAAQANQSAEKTPNANSAPEKPSPDKQEVYRNIIEKIDSLGLDRGMAKAVEKKVTGFIDAKAKQAGDKASEIYAKLAEDPMTLSKMMFAVIQRTAPTLYEELKETGKLNDKGENAASLTQKTELSKAISQLVGQIEVPDAFNVEIDDSEWDNALIKAFGFPMINLTSPLVREMLRAQEPKAQKRAYKEFKKQLKSDPDVAKALGIGLMGTLGLGGSSGDAKTDTKTKIDTRTEGVNADGKVLVEGPITDIANALKSPVDVLKIIAQNKGTPCHRNNLVVMYDEIEGKSGDSSETVKVTPLGASGGTLVDLNLSVPVPMNHLTAFYSVVDPKASFKSYAKAMAEVNKKSDNAKLGVGGAAAAAGKQLLSKIPLLGRGAKKDLEANESDGIAKALGELAMYVKENGHPPFYLLKPKSDPKEIDRWSDEDAANGYQMITMMVEGHKAGMILKAKTAEALFKVG